MEDLYLVNCKAVETEESYTLFLLESMEKKIPVFTESEAAEILLTLQGKLKPRRPLPHHLIYSLLENTRTKVLKAILYDAEEGVILSQVFFETEQDGVKRVLQMETRASDSLIIALTHDAPVYCTKAVLEKQGISS